MMKHHNNNSNNAIYYHSWHFSLQRDNKQGCQVQKNLKKVKFGQRQFQKRPNPEDEEMPNKGQLKAKFLKKS